MKPNIGPLASDLGDRSAQVAISVVVSSSNRAGNLPLLFEALRGQVLTGHVLWELVFVDNRSTDKTAAVVKDFSTRAGFPVLYAFEGRRGKSHGVNSGIAMARGQIIALTDDDCVPSPDWLESLWRHFERHPDVDCVGGRVEIYDPADAPITVRVSTEAAVVDASNYSPENIPIIGCNMAIRAPVFEAVGLYDTALGPGSRVGVAEDVDMLYRLVRAGCRIDYDPAARMLHNHGRRSAVQVEQVRRGYLIGRGAFYCKHILRGDRAAAKWAYWELRNVLGEAWTGRAVTSRSFTAMRHAGLLFAGALRYLRHRNSNDTKARPAAKPL
jgi:GT2 family glycosyltransferase